MLEGGHSTSICVQVWIDLDAGDAEAAGLEDDADAAGGDALAEPADDAARDQHVLGGRGPRLLARRRGHEAGGGGGGGGAAFPWGKGIL